MVVDSALYKQLALVEEALLTTRSAHLKLCDGAKGVLT